MRKAVVIGANSKGNAKLDAAEKYANKIAETLEYGGYSVLSFTETEKTAEEMLKEIGTFASETSNNDTFLFYFVGHGIAESNTLLLTLNTTEFSKPETSLNFKHIEAKLDPLYCKAKNKFIILDCCHAKRATDNINLRNSINTYCLTAANIFGREIPNLDNGEPAPFVSYYFHKALSGEEKISFDNRITPHGLLKYLSKQRENYMTTTGENLSKIELLGKEENEFVIVENSAEIPGFITISSKFITKERNKHLENANIYNQQNFYGALPHVQWWGVFNNLIAPKQIYSEIKAHIIKGLQTSFKPIITFITGSGGIGKSTILRNLAFDLHNTEINTKIYWLDDWLEFEENSQTFVFFENNQTQLILIDNWNGIDTDEKKGIIRFIRKSEKYNNIKIIITGRQPENALKKQMFGNSFFNLDKIKQSVQNRDNKKLISKIEEITDNKTWKLNAVKLQQQNITKAKTFQLLFILSRLSEQNAEVKHTKNFEETFNEIIQNDIETLRNDTNTKGFAYALIDFANLYLSSFDYKTTITKDTFLRLADFYHDNNTHFLYQNFKDIPLEKEQWKILPYYISIFYNKKDKQGLTGTLITFNKDDLSEAIGEIYNGEFLSRQKQVLEFIINDESMLSASKILYVSARYGEIFSEQEILKYIKILLNKRNTHHAYVSLLVNKNINFKIDSDKRLELIKKYIEISSTNNWFSSMVISFYKKNTQPLINIIERFEINTIASSFQIFKLYFLEKNERQIKAKELLDNSNTSPETIKTCFNILGKTEFSEKKAKEFLDNSNTNPETIKTCFNVLGKTEFSEEKAEAFLDNPNTSPGTINICLKILGKTEFSEEKAKVFLDNPNTNADTINTCFNILGKTEFSEQKAKEFLNNSNTNADTINTCFNILGKTKFSEQKAKEFLDNPNTSSEAINTCFNILGKTEFSEQKAKEFLNNSNTNADTINTCLKILGKTAFTEGKAKAFLDNPNTNFQTINTCLRLLDDKAFEYAINFINDNEITKHNIFTFIHCIRITQNEKKTKQLLKNILNKSGNQNRIKFSILNKPLFKIDIWKKEVEKILTNWHGSPRKLVYASLLGYQSQIKFTELICFGIILSWEREIQYQIDKGFNEIFDLHIAFSLGHPNLRKQAKNISEMIYKKQQVEQNFGSHRLKEVVENIVTKEIYPEWDEEYKY